LQWYQYGGNNVAKEEMAAKIWRRGVSSGEDRSVSKSAAIRQRAHLWRWRKRQRGENIFKAASYRGMASTAAPAAINS